MARADREDEDARAEAAAEVIGLFRSHGVDIHAQTLVLGDTALHLAVARAGETATSAAAIAALASTERRSMVAADAVTLEASSEACALAAEAEALAVALIGEGAALHVRNVQRGLSALDLAQLADEEATKAAGDFAHAGGSMGVEASVVNAQRTASSTGRGGGGGGGGCDSRSSFGGRNSMAEAESAPPSRSQGLVVSVLRHVSHAPRWAPDEHVAFCESCPCLGRKDAAGLLTPEFPATERFVDMRPEAQGVKFTKTRRKHHCRHCGRVVCGACSKVKMALPKLNIFEKKRVCHLCWDVLNFRKLA